MGKTGKRTDSLPQASSSISKILERTHDNDHYHSFKPCDCISSAQQEIEAYVLDIIGEDDPDTTSDPIFIAGQNQLRREQRAKLKGKDGNSHS